MWNPESWALEFGIQLKESGIRVPLTKTGIQYLKSGIRYVESLEWGETYNKPFLEQRCVWWSQLRQCLTSENEKLKLLKTGS